MSKKKKTAEEWAARFRQLARDKRVGRGEAPQKNSKEYKTWEKIRTCPLHDQEWGAWRVTNIRFRRGVDPPEQEFKYCCCGFHCQPRFESAGTAEENASSSVEQRVASGPDSGPSQPPPVHHFEPGEGNVTAEEASSYVDQIEASGRASSLSEASSVHHGQQRDGSATVEGNAGTAGEQTEPGGSVDVTLQPSSVQDDDDEARNSVDGNVLVENNSAAVHSTEAGVSEFHGTLTDDAEVIAVDVNGSSRATKVCFFVPTISGVESPLVSCVILYVGQNNSKFWDMNLEKKPLMELSSMS